MSRTCKLAFVALLGVTGLVVGAATEAQAFILAPRFVGAQVTAVLPNSPAQRVGLEIGDVIVAIDGRGVYTPDDFTALTAWKRQVVSPFATAGPATMLRPRRRS
jgi:S1-C subfamily serine protease